MAILVDNYSAPLGTRLIIPTHIAPKGGQTIHPSVTLVDKGFGEYRYWMGTTPYPYSNDAHEDPNVVTSGNGSKWEVPDGMTNPLDNAPGGTVHNSDPNLFFDSETDTLYCFWRQVNKGSTANRETLFYKTSTNGSTWSARRTAFVFAADAGGSKMLSPELLKVGPDWYMYCVDTTNGHRVAIYRATALTTASWGTPSFVTFTGLPGGRKPWHVGVKPVNDMGTTKMVMLLNTVNSVGGYELFLALGAEVGGTTFKAHNKPIVPTIGPWHNQVYKSDFIARANAAGDVTFDIWYTGWDKKKNIWNTLRTTAAPLRDTIPPSAPTALSSAGTSWNAVKLAWKASTDDKKVTGYEIKRDGQVIATVTGTTYTDKKVWAGNNYSYTVTATDGGKNRSAPSNTLAVTTPLAPVIPPPESAGPVDGSPMGTVPTVRLLGRGHLGPVGNIASLSVTEDASPTSFTDSGPGVGGFSLIAQAKPGIGGTDSLRGQVVDIYDPRAGVQRGIIDSVTTDDEFSVRISASSELIKTVVNRTAAPFTGTLGGAIRYYLGLCDIVSGIEVESWIEGTKVHLPFWDGQVWGQLKKLMALYRFELGYVAGTIMARSLRTRWIDEGFQSQISRELGQVGGAALTRVTYYRNKWQVNKTLYPLVENNILDRQVIQVDASETTVVNFPVDAWVSSVIQPVHILNLGEAKEDGVSAYSVIDKNGAAVSPTNWKNGGGLVTYAIGEDGRSIDVTVRGMGTNNRAPYRIASTSQDKTYQYSSISIAGSGVFFEKGEVVLQSGTPVDNAPVTDETSIDDPLISTPAQAWGVAIESAVEASGALQTIRLTTPHITRSTQDGLTMYPSIGEYNNIIGNSKTIGDMNAEVGAQTVRDFNKSLAAIKERSFENQAFGAMAGARFNHRNSIYRLTSVSLDDDGFSWDGIDDLRVSDMNAKIGSMTIAQFNAAIGDRTIAEFAVAPMAPFTP